MKTTVEQIADAVLYEGYILYPYRPSSLKNRQRWNFGGILPREYAESQRGSESWRSQTEILAQGDGSPELAVKLRFLHLVSRQVAELSRPAKTAGECSDSDFCIVPSLTIGGRLFQTWQEALECEVEFPSLRVQAGQENRGVFFFHFPSFRSVEPISGSDGQIVALLIRKQQEIHGSVEISCKRIRDTLFRVRIELANLTPLPSAAALERDQAMMFSFASSHWVLSISGGEFVSLLDPSEDLAVAASECQNIGAYPVLAGEEGIRSTMLASPVILYDYPKIAPESAGDLFDGTEIDEILTLRIMALTDEEKSEMRQSDERARVLLDRIESDPQHLAKLHGALRDTKPANPRPRTTP